MNNLAGKKFFLIFVLLVVLAFGFTFGFLISFNKYGGQGNSQVVSEQSGKIFIFNLNQVKIAEVEFFSDGQTCLQIGSQGNLAMLKVDSSGRIAKD